MSALLGLSYCLNRKSFLAASAFFGTHERIDIPFTNPQRTQFGRLVGKHYA
jgi:hypothetical protein